MANRTGYAIKKSKSARLRPSDSGGFGGKKGLFAPDILSLVLSAFALVGKPLFYIILLSAYVLVIATLLIKILSKLIYFLLTNISFPKIKLSKKKAFLPKIKFRFPKIRRRKVKILFPKSLASLKAVGFLLGVLASLATMSYTITAFIKDLPSSQTLGTRQQNLTTKIYDRNGKLLYKIYKEENRTPISLDGLPIFLKQATIAIEDKDFYYHNGLSFRGILRAAFQNVFFGKKTGGSTITQQLIKNTLLSSEKTWRRKIKEAALALLVEKKYTKDQILEMYLNQVGYGGAAYGIEEAGQKYFGKPASKLNLAEASLLAGLTASPTKYSPFGHTPETAKERQSQVLRRMVEDNYITDTQMQEAKKQKLEYAPQEIDVQSPHFVMFIKDLLAQKYGEKMVEQGGLEVKTSLDLDIQELAQNIVKEEVEKLGNLHITNGAVLVTNPKTGEILAMVGSKDYFAKDIQGNVNVTTASRQPGSSIKPVNYSIALENGFTAATLIDDSPITYQVPGQPPYSPKNYDSRFHGQVPLRIALASSYNVPAVKLLATFGVAKMIQRGEEMGITTWNDPSRFGLSLTLGGGEVKMTDMAVAYSVLANNGIRVELNPILEVKDSQGKILENNPTGEETPVLNPGIAFLLTNILSDNSARTPAFGANSQLNISNRPVAVKTGTTQNLRDNWTIGYTPSLLTAVWVGNNDNSAMSFVASGVTGASPIWRKIMDSLLADKPAENFPVPEDIHEVTICQTTASLPCDGCPLIKNEYFILGTEPRFACDPQKFKESTPSAGLVF